MESNIVVSEQLLTEVHEKVRLELNIKVDFGDSDDLTLLGLDSMTTVKLLVAIEEQFQLAFEDEDLFLDNFRTVARIVSLIEKRKG